MKKQDLIVLILIHALFLLLIYVFQGVVFPRIRIGGLVPLLLPAASTGVALYEGRVNGGVVGLFAGILCDVSFNQPVGTFTVLLTLTGLFIGTLADAYILQGFVTYIISCAAVLVVSAFVQMFPLMLNPQHIPVQSLVATAVGQTLYSLLLALPIWFFVRALGKRAEKVKPTGQTR